MIAFYAKPYLHMKILTLNHTYLMATLDYKMTLIDILDEHIRNVIQKGLVFENPTLLYIPEIFENSYFFANNISKTIIIR